LRKWAAEKKAQLPLSARTIAGRIEDMAEGIETQLLERIVKSPWFAIQCDETTHIENKPVLLVFDRYLMKRIFMRTFMYFVLAKTISQPQNYSSLSMNISQEN